MGLLDKLKFLEELKGKFSLGRKSLDEDDEYDEEYEEDDEEEYEEDDEYEEDEDDEEDDGENESLIERLKGSFHNSTKGKSGNKKKLTPITAIVILGLVYLGVDMLTEKKNPSLKTQPRRKIQRRQKTIQKAHKKKNLNPEQKIVKKQLPKKRAINHKNNDVLSNKEQEKKPADQLDIDQLLSDMGQKSEVAKKNLPPEKKQEATKIMDSSSLTGSSSKGTTLDMPKKTSKISYVKPPEYDLLGRGLVYNCKEHFWACVDKGSYFQCKDNYSWAKKTDNSYECVPREVYRNIKDCRIVQVYRINTAVSTDFCQH